MNPNIKINRIYSSSVGLEKRKPNFKLKFKYQKNSLNKILRDINTLKHEIFDNKSNNIFNYNFNNFIHKPKTTSKRYNNNNAFLFSDFSNELNSKEDKNNLNNNKILKWNYSFFPSRNKIKFERNLSCKKQRINDILNRKDPLIIEDWKKPRMVKILEKNSIIEEAIVSKPWKFFPYNNN